MDDMTSSVTTTVKSPGNAKCVGLVGPMKAAWAQTFQEGMNTLSPIIVIVWHREWIHAHCELWRELYETLVSSDDKTQILVIIFGDTPDQLGDVKRGNPLDFLLRAMVEDAALIAEKTQGCGWASISDVEHFKSNAFWWKHPNDGNYNDSAVLRLCQCCMDLVDSKRDVKPLLSEYFEFRHNAKRYRAKKLHAVKGESEADKIRSSLRILKWFTSLSVVPRRLQMNVLLVENNLKELNGKHSKLIEGILSKVAKSDVSPFGCLPQSNFYLVQENFHLLKTAQDKDVECEVLTCKDGQLASGKTAMRIPWAEFDLILQDIVLDKDEEELEGLGLAKQYFEVAPQALVFVLTNLDVESLVGSGDVDWKYVDCIVSKDSLETIWYEYWRCFRERFGRMFWPDWLSANKEDERILLRNVFGSLRKWQYEPAILGHGQGVAEMIDHAHRHTSGLWRLADDVIGTLMECGAADRDLMSLNNRVCFALSVWLHDIGHRGNEFTDDSVEVRANHAGISEYLLLRNPSAYGVGWLEKYCARPECLTPKLLTGMTASLPHLEFRNSAEPCSPREGEKSVCLLRKVGLLCRHHQSNAPLDSGSLQKMCERGKFPSPYSRYKDVNSKETSQQELACWLDKSKPLSGWCGSGVRLLEEFSLGSEEDKKAFLTWAGLLRMLDGLQIHRSRVGSSSCLGSFLEYLSVRSEWSRLEITRLDETLGEMRPGSTEYQEYIGRRLYLERFTQLLNVQYVHWWRQLAVREMEVAWRWSNSLTAIQPLESRSVGWLVIRFALDQSGLAKLRELKGLTVRGKKKFDLPKILEARYVNEVESKCNDLKEKQSANKLTDKDRAQLDQLERLVPELAKLNSSDAVIRDWIADFFTEIVWKEHSSQFAEGNTDAVPLYLGLISKGNGIRILADCCLTPVVVLECIK